MVSRHRYRNFKTPKGFHCHRVIKFLSRNGQVMIIWSGVDLYLSNICQKFWVQRSSSGKYQKYFYETDPDLTQWAHNVKMTSYQRRCDVITSHRCWYDVILMLCACWEESTVYPKMCMQHLQTSVANIKLFGISGTVMFWSRRDLRAFTKPAFFVSFSKKCTRQVPQSQTAALPRPQEEEETDKSKQAQSKQTYEKH